MGMIRKQLRGDDKKQFQGMIGTIETINPNPNPDKNDKRFISLKEGGGGFRMRWGYSKGLGCVGGASWKKKSLLAFF